MSAFLLRKSSIVYLILSATLTCFITGCTNDLKRNEQKKTGVSLIVLGTIQDAGSPQIGCKKACCKNLFDNRDQNRMVSCLGLSDARNNKSYLFDATPDITMQLNHLKKATLSENEMPSAIFLTHGHIGHYTGLVYLGKESANSTSIPVYAMPRMTMFLNSNGPWDQLVTNKNIELKAINNKNKIKLDDSLSVTPILVPHRDEYSETVGYLIQGPQKSALYIPDIDKWGKWQENIQELIQQVDYAFLDGTFYDGEEINHRDISEIPHPFVIESMTLFEGLSKLDKNKIYFIHFNHTNPLLRKNQNATKSVTKNGFHIATVFDEFIL